MPKGSDQFTSQQVVCLILIAIFLTSAFWFVFFPMLFSNESKDLMNKKHERQEARERRARELEVLKKLKRSM